MSQSRIILPEYDKSYSKVLKRSEDQKFTWLQLCSTSPVPAYCMAVKLLHKWPRQILQSQQQRWNCEESCTVHSVWPQNSIKIFWTNFKQYNTIQYNTIQLWGKLTIIKINGYILHLEPKLRMFWAIFFFPIFLHVVDKETFTLLAAYSRMARSTLVHAIMKHQLAGNWMQDIH